MRKQTLKLITLFALMTLAFGAKSQNVLEIEKYKVFTDAINQIQQENAELLAKEGYKKDTINYNPIIICSKTIFETDSIGFFLNESLKANKSIFEGNFLNLEKFAIVENNKLICLDTAYINLYYMLDSLCKPNNRLSNSFFFKSKVIFKDKPKEKRFGLFRTNHMKFWRKFYKKYPNSFGIFEVSDVFFSEDRNLAILYLGYNRQALSGKGAIYLLRKENGIWKIKKSRDIWMS